MDGVGSLFRDDPHELSRAKYGSKQESLFEAAKDSHPLIGKAWVSIESSTRVCTIELYWTRPPTPKEKRESARAAAKAVRAWIGPRGYALEVRVTKGKLPKWEEGKRGGG
jgi:hypothetical protein